MDAISARQFSGAQESPLHARLKLLVAELLDQDPRSQAGSVIVDRYLVTERGKRRPDVRAVYQDVPTVFEVQLATTQIPIIVQREDFYKKEGCRLVWLTWNFEPPAGNERLPSSIEDVFYSHAYNLFSLDDETIARSRQEKQFILRVFWKAEGVWASKPVRLAELSWLPSGCAFAVAPWHRDFLQRWRGATGDNGTRGEGRDALLDELIAKVGLAGTTRYDFEEEHVDDLINCLLSLKDGHPVGSRQKNLVELLNTFFHVKSRHCFTQIVKRFADLTGHSDLFKVRSLQAKVAVASSTAQCGQRSVAGRIVLKLFSDTFDVAARGGKAETTTH